MESFAITADMLKPVTDAITSGVGTLVPIGVGIMAVLIGVSLIPKIVYRFF